MRVSVVGIENGTKTPFANKLKLELTLKKGCQPVYSILPGSDVTSRPAPIPSTDFLAWYKTLIFSQVEINCGAGIVRYSAPATHQNGGTETCWNDLPFAQNLQLIQWMKEIFANRNNVECRLDVVVEEIVRLVHRYILPELPLQQGHIDALAAASRDVDVNIQVSERKVASLVDEICDTERYMADIRLTLTEKINAHPREIKVADRFADSPIRRHLDSSLATNRHHVCPDS